MSAFLPESMPPAGVTSIGDDNHNYPYSRDDDEIFVAPGDVPVWGLAPSKAPAAAYVEVDFGDENPAPTATPPTVETPVHEATRRVPAVIEQVGLFLKTGELKHTCDGPCDPD